MRKLLRALSACLLLLTGNAFARDEAATAANRAELDKAMRDLCSRDVVLLGEENHHGNGRANEVRAILAERLVRECGFSQFLFESEFYEFVGFNRALADGTATQARLDDAVGRFWTTGTETQPLLSWLFAAARAGKLRLGGIDPQMGSVTAKFAPRELGGILVTFLPPTQRAECRVTFDRHHRWDYDAAHPYDNDERAWLLGCIAPIRDAFVNHANAWNETTMIARAYLRYAEYGPQFENDRQSFNARDRGMFELLMWYLAGEPRKTIVWCATVHAAKSGVDRYIPLGEHLHAQLGERMATLGFIALTGSYGNPLPVKPILPLQADLLEAQAAPSLPASLRYLDRATLSAHGAVPSRVKDYAKPQARNWAEVLDGLIVLDVEYSQTLLEAE